jgi:hypothetical protein
VTDRNIEKDVLSTESPNSDSKPEIESSVEPHTTRPISSLTDPQPQGSSDPKKRGGGPKTPAGKARSSQNACRHHILARVHIATPEETEAFDAHLKEFLEALAPVGPIERDLAIEYASLRFRLKKIAATEESVFALGVNDFSESLSANPQLGAVLARGMTWLRDARSLQLLGVYESRLRSAAAKTLAELERLQTARKEAYQEARADALRLTKLALHEGRQYDPGADFEPARDYGQFVYGTYASVFDR